MKISQKIQIGIMFIVSAASAICPILLAILYYGFGVR
jgi:hypothetical protein